VPLALKIPEAYGWYLGSIVGISVLIRVILSALRASEYPKKRWQAFVDIFHGFRADAQGAPDFWQPSILGVLELAIYPVLLASGKPEYIGAWLLFKTIPRFGSWEKHRNVYQRFLIGNALVLLASYGLMRFFVARI
jgi:hypothetical protein